MSAMLSGGDWPHQGGIVGGGHGDVARAKVAVALVPYGGNGPCSHIRHIFIEGAWDHFSSLRTVLLDQKT